MAQFNARRVMDWLPEKVANLVEAWCWEHIGAPELVDIDVTTRAHFDQVVVTFTNGQRIVARFYVLEDGAELD